VKKLLVCALIVLMAVFMAACGDDDATNENKETGVNMEQKINAPTPTPTAVPTPTPFPRVAVSDYVLIWKSNANRGINYMMPVHWKIEYEGERYIGYMEPVPEGETPFRIALGNKKVSREPDSDQMRKELREYLTVFKDREKDFYSDGKILRDYSLVKFKGYSMFYEYTDELDTRIKGFAIMATYNRRIYLMNFYGPEDRFEELMPIGMKILNSVSRS